MSAPRRTTIASRNLARQRAERNRCPECGRKSALKIVAHPGQVVRHCRWDDCPYESATDLTAADPDG